MASPPSTSSPVNGLRTLVLDQWTFKTLAPGSAVFDCTASVIGLALDLLECRPSIAALRSMTNGVAKVALELRHLVDDDSGIDKKIKEYMALIRGSFPHVVITKRQGMSNKNGRTTKRDCAGEFEPKAAAVIEISQTVGLIRLLCREKATFQEADATQLMTRLINAREDLRNSKPNAVGRFRTLHARLAITMAHELVHVYNLFLRRDRAEHTPLDIKYGPFGNSMTGESGRYWEHIVFGGYVDMRLDKASGVEAIAIRDASGQRAWQFLPAVINGILSRNFNLWLAPGPLHDPEHPLNELNKQHPRNNPQHPLGDPQHPEHPHPPITKVMGVLAWKENFEDIFAASPAKGPTEPPELLTSQITWLTGKGASALPKYNMAAADLRAFPLHPRTVLRYHAIK